VPTNRSPIRRVIRSRVSPGPSRQTTLVPTIDSSELAKF
jgi:hypothetical protein